MIDLTHISTTFACDAEGGQTLTVVDFRPVIRRWVSHVSPENIDVKVGTWNRATLKTTWQTVKLPEADKWARALKVMGWRMEQWA